MERTARVGNPGPCGAAQAFSSFLPVRAAAREPVAPGRLRKSEAPGRPSRYPPVTAAVPVPFTMQRRRLRRPGATSPA